MQTSEFFNLKQIPTMSKNVVKCEPSQVIGVVNIDEDVIIHPTATIRAGVNGSITIGKGCIVEELCLIESSESSHMVIGQGNLFQVFSRSSFHPHQS
jgi:carbonic anhydrase/acetyltransferase-like protein (isoleucine patch superfamily)